MYGVMVILFLLV